jgi:hypothetical protein
VVNDNLSFWDIKRRSPVKIDRRFGGTHRKHLNVASFTLVFAWLIL